MTQSEIDKTTTAIAAKLKEKFPDTEFTINSDSDAVSVDFTINWIDGPTATQVQEITEPFEKTPAIVFVWLQRSYSKKAIIKTIKALKAANQKGLDITLRHTAF